MKQVLLIMFLLGIYGCSATSQHFDTEIEQDASVNDSSLTIVDVSEKDVYEQGEPDPCGDPSTKDGIQIPIECKREPKRFEDIQGVIDPAPLLKK